MTPTLRPLSGMGEKAAACFLLEADGARLLFDLGRVEGPDGTPDLTGVGPVDAIVLSHMHPDHAAALDLAPLVGGPPVWATETTALSLGLSNASLLPLRGTVEIAGLRLTLGRDGHAPGGVWIHVAIGEGLLYCGDVAFQSDAYPFDPPPPAGTVVLDASFGLRRDGRDVDAIVALVEAVAETPLLLLPVPPWGRGVELALVLRQLGVPVAVDAPLRRTLAALAERPEALHPGVAPILAALAADAPQVEDRPADWQGVLLTSDPTARNGATAGWVARLADRPGAIRFSGHCPPGTPSAELRATGRAGRLPWPVHPTLDENLGLARAVEARRIVPAFCAPAHYPGFAVAARPAILATGPEVAL